MTLRISLAERSLGIASLLSDFSRHSLIALLGAYELAALEHTRRPASVDALEERLAESQSLGFQGDMSL